MEFRVPAHHETLYDNMRTVVCARRAKHRFQTDLLELSRRHGFLPRLCQPYRPQFKGKVERGIRYIRYIRAYNDVQIISDDSIRVGAASVMQEVSTFVFLNKDHNVELQDKIVKIARDRVSLFQKIAQEEVCKPYEDQF